MPDQANTYPFSFWAVIGGAGLLVAAVIVFIGMYLWKGTGGIETTLPVVIIAGVVILLIVLGLLAVCFSILNLANQNQALGLPEGSVRAVIAIMLLVLFAIVSIFLYSSVATVRLQSITNVAADQLPELRRRVPVDLVVPATGNGPFTVYFRTSNPAGDDLAKQLIVLLGTLVTAVASFYFGASSVTSAVANKEGAPVQQAPPKPTGIVQPSLTRDGSPQALTITGENLAKVNAVKLVKDGVAIPAEFKGATATQVDSKIVIKSNQEQGKWDVIVSDGTTEVKLPVQVQVT
jgi:heme/copper-type cytochrome/quinol oxidase subunit 2